jgi:lysophospholipase L1-like esterase
VVADNAELVFSYDEGDIVRVDEAGMTDRERGEPSSLTAHLGGDGSVRRVVVWLPHNAAVELLDIEADAAVEAGRRSGPRWVHYGSSISHCLEADTPLGVWPTIVARATNLDLHNLGLAGNALLDGFVARSIRDLEAYLITVKVGINVVNFGGFRRRTFFSAVHNFLDTVREGHPDTPIVVISPIFCSVHEDAPGPTEWTETGQMLPTSVARHAQDGQLTLTDIRALLSSNVTDRSEDDPHLHYLDGRVLFGEADVRYLPDGLHPDTGGYALMGVRMTDLIQRWLPTHRARSSPQVG